MKNPPPALPPHAKLRLLQSQSTNDFKIKRYSDYDLTVISINLLRASYDKSTSFKELIDKLLRKGIKRIIIDLSKSEFIDSAFMGALVFAIKSILSLNGVLKLVYSKKINSSTFFLTGMDKVFHTYPNLGTAITSFNKPA